MRIVRELMAISLFLLQACVRPSTQPSAGASLPVRHPSLPATAPGWTFEAFEYRVAQCPASAETVQPVLQGPEVRNYPEPLRLMRIQGPVTLTGTVDPSGQVSDVVVVTGVHPQLDAVAISDVLHWRFLAASCGSKPVSATFTVTLRYAVS